METVFGEFKSIFGQEAEYKRRAVSVASEAVWQAVNGLLPKLGYNEVRIADFRQALKAVEGSHPQLKPTLNAQLKVSFLNDPGSGRLDIEAFDHYSYLLDRLTARNQFVLNLHVLMNRDAQNPFDEKEVAWRASQHEPISLTGLARNARDRLSSLVRRKVPQKPPLKLLSKDGHWEVWGEPITSSSSPTLPFPSTST